MTDLPGIQDLLPHRGAMRFLDEALELAPDRAVCRGRVREDNPFLRGDATGAVTLDPVALVEFIAQAAAALVSAHDLARGPVQGWLVGVRNLDLSGDPVTVGALLDVEVREVAKVGGFASFDGVVRSDGRVVAYGNVKVFKAGEDAP